MEVNANFNERVIVHSDQLEWQPSPMPGVDRRMLDRMGNEVARATSIVRYQPKSHFSPHVHHGGEEFFVLEGVFQDEHGDYPAGSYVRNPPQSRHRPGTEVGCVIFVKLWQFDSNDRNPVSVNFDQMETAVAPERPGVKITELFEDLRERVRIEYWQPGAHVALDATGGLEAFVLEGRVTEGQDVLIPGSWLRIPVGGKLTADAGDTGAKLWVKTGHLRSVQAPPEATPLANANA